MNIEKKVWPKYFQDISDGIKTYELRLADFNVSAGDILVLKEWDPNTHEYTGRELTKTVTYVLKTKEVPFWKTDEIDEFGYQIISFK